MIVHESPRSEKTVDLHKRQTNDIRDTGLFYIDFNSVDDVLYRLHDAQLVIETRSMIRIVQGLEAPPIF